MSNIYIPPLCRVEPNITSAECGPPSGALGARRVVGAVRVRMTFLWMSDHCHFSVRFEYLLTYCLC